MAFPKAKVAVDGVPVSGLFFARLISLTVIDREGIQSDTLQMEFSDDFPHFQSPRRGAIVTVTIIAGLGNSYVGAFVVDRVEFQCRPYKIIVNAHSADLRTGMKTNRNKHWDKKSVREIVEEKAGDYGLQAKIADAVSGHVYEWLGQQDESDLSFLERLARRHGALFTIKNGTLLWLERGAGKTADGTVLPPVTITAFSVLQGACRVSETDVDRFKTIKAYWQDRMGSKRQEVVVDADPEADGEHVLRDPFSSKEEAEAAAKAAAREMTRGLVECSCSIEGRPNLMAGLPVIFAGLRPNVDGREFLLDQVTHTFTKSGLRTAFTGKLKADA